MQGALSNGFCEMSQNEKEQLSGGNIKEGACTFLGIVGLAWSLPVSFLNPGAGLALAGGSLACLDSGI